jgi:hypothetical protein
MRQIGLLYKTFLNNPSLPTLDTPIINELFDTISVQLNNADILPPRANYPPGMMYKKNYQSYEKLELSHKTQDNIYTNDTQYLEIADNGFIFRLSNKIIMTANPSEIENTSEIEFDYRNVEELYNNTIELCRFLLDEQQKTEFIEWAKTYVNFEKNLFDVIQYGVY